MQQVSGICHYYYTMYKYVAIVLNQAPFNPQLPTKWTYSIIICGWNSPLSMWGIEQPICYMTLTMWAMEQSINYAGEGTAHWYKWEMEIGNRICSFVHLSNNTTHVHKINIETLYLFMSHSSNNNIAGFVFEIKIRQLQQLIKVP